ncbi:transcription initiation factor IIB family protein [Metallosphaera tengchongensis]|uniref:Transcription initiation factor IIB n=1 Tax=Metallosphaera tengchongensis TaxID=1532350 RepID=A0A6N0NR72_9CREN|nr:transcription initiation factor IIB family protein [Metallosphaera tengchongensis]QKQ99373.1 transcription initiation factor IIB family protein [Metallosphaera tengchongensis]
MQCPICGGIDIILDPSRGLYVCRNDGVVIEENLVDQGPEWRVFDPSDHQKKSRVGAAVTERVHDKGIATVIGFGGRVKDKLKAVRLQRLQNKTRVSSKDKKIVTFLSILNSEAGKLGLPVHVKEDAAGILKKLVESGLARRVDMYALVGATLYYVCRVNKIPIYPQEIKDRYQLNSSDLWNALERVQKVAKAEKINYPYPVAGEGVIMRGPSPIEHIPKIINTLKLPQPIETKAADIVDMLYRNGLTSGKSYLSIAAAAVYLVSTLMDHKKTQKEVAEALKITEVTIRNRYKEIIDALDIEVSL